MNPSRSKKSSDDLRKGESETLVMDKIEELLNLLNLFAHPYLFIMKNEDKEKRESWEKEVKELRNHGRMLYMWFQELNIQVGVVNLQQKSKQFVYLMNGIIQETKPVIKRYIDDAKAYKEPKALFDLLEEQRERGLSLFFPPRAPDATNPSSTPNNCERTRKQIYQLMAQFKPNPAKEEEYSSSESPPPAPPTPVLPSLTVEEAERWMESYWRSIREPTGDEEIRDMHATSDLERDFEAKKENRPNYFKGRTEIEIEYWRPLE